MTDTTMIHGLGVALAFGAMISPPPQSYRLIVINGSARPQRWRRSETAATT